MKLGIRIRYDDDFEEAVKTASKAGFKTVSVCFGASKCFHNSDWEKDLIKIENSLRQNNLECIQTHLPFYSVFSSAEILDKDLDSAMVRCIEATGKLGAEWAVYHPRTAINDNCSREKSFKYAVEAITPLVESAQKYNTGIALENLPFFPSHDINLYCSDFEELCKLHDYFNSEKVGICWDFGHAHLMKWEDEAKVIKTVGDRIKCTHIHNNRQLDDDHNLPSQGSIEWEKIMPAFGEFYKGSLMLEISYKPNTFLESYFRHAYDCLKYLENLIK